MLYVQRTLANEIVENLMWFQRRVRRNGAERDGMGWVHLMGETHADAVGVSLFALFRFYFVYFLYYISLCLGVPNERSLKCIDTKRTTLCRGATVLDRRRRSNR